MSEININCIICSEEKTIEEIYEIWDYYMIGSICDKHLTDIAGLILDKILIEVEERKE